MSQGAVTDISHRLISRSRVNGELRQNSNTRLFLADIPHLISELSRGITLVPGDIIATGTPAGVGMGFEPPRWLRSGDTVECEIENIGVLRRMKAQYLTPGGNCLEKEDGTPDLEGNKRVYDHPIKGGVSGLVIMGSTGEFFSMTMEDQKQLIDLAADYVKGRTRIFIGVSRMIAREAIELANYFYQKGLHEVMVVSPYYFKFTQEGLESFFDLIASKYARGLRKQ